MKILMGKENTIGAESEKIPWVVGGMDKQRTNCFLRLTDKQGS